MMPAMKTVIRFGVALAIGAALAGCMGAYYEHPAAQYVHRSDTVTLSAGNAKDVNAATHVIDPWPRRVANRRIPGHGERMVGAVERYRGRPAARTDAQAGQVPSVPGAGPTSATTSGTSGTAAATGRAIPSRSSRRTRPPGSWGGVGSRRGDGSTDAAPPAAVARRGRRSAPTRDAAHRDPDRGPADGRTRARRRNRRAPGAPRPRAAAAARARRPPARARDRRPTRRCRPGARHGRQTGRPR